jgi:hypothetical protein
VSLDSHVRLENPAGGGAYLDRPPSITLRLDRGAPTLAAEIRRRLLPKAEPSWRNGEEILDRARAYEQARDSALARCATALPALEHRGDDGHPRLYLRLAGGHVDVQAYHEGVRLD